MAGVDEIIAQHDFVPIGWLDYRLQLSLWWRPNDHIQLIVAGIGKHHRGDAR